MKPFDVQFAGPVITLAVAAYSMPAAASQYLKLIASPARKPSIGTVLLSSPQAAKPRRAPGVTTTPAPAHKPAGVNTPTSSPAIRAVPSSSADSTNRLWFSPVSV